MKTYILPFFLLILGVSGITGTWLIMESQKTYLKEGIVSLEVQLENKEEELARLRAEHASSTAALKTVIDELTLNAQELTADRDGLAEDLKGEAAKVSSIQKDVSKALKTVGVLDKLSKTDSELLQKYSKVYFLNEHYAPPKVLPVEKEYLYTETDPEKLHAQVMPFFEEMVKDALDDDIKLYVKSAFRSFDEQKVLKNAYTVSYGTGANAFSADQGYSEHQLGTTIDFTTTGINGGLDGFDKTPAYTWLQKNAYRYGFVLSYPKNNKYYIFEPWHWRFVGTDLARKLQKDGKYFYDMDQREIDTYLISIFD